MSFAKDVNRRLPRDLRADSIVGHILSAPVAAVISTLSAHQRQWTDAAMTKMFEETMKKYENDKGKLDSIRLMQNIVGRVLQIKPDYLLQNGEKIITKDDQYWTNDPEGGQVDLKAFYDTWSQYVIDAPLKLTELVSERDALESDLKICTLKLSHPPKGAPEHSMRLTQVLGNLQMILKRFPTNGVRFRNDAFLIRPNPTPNDTETEYMTDLKKTLDGIYAELKSPTEVKERLVPNVDVTMTERKPTPTDELTTAVGDMTL